MTSGIVPLTKRSVSSPEESSLSKKTTTCRASLFLLRPGLASGLFARGYTDYLRTIRKNIYYTKMEKCTRIKTFRFINFYCSKNVVCKTQSARSMSVIHKILREIDSEKPEKNEPRFHNKKLFCTSVETVFQQATNKTKQ